MVEYRIDDLARVAGTTVRNVRVYQDRELLPPPRKVGRTAVYSDAHLTRLRLIISMLDRGYAFAQIKEMIGAWESGRSLGAVLGLEETVVQRSWARSQPRSLSLHEVERDFKGDVEGDTVHRAIELGLIEKRGRGFVAPQPELYDAAVELVELGIPLSDVIDLAAEMFSKIDELGDQLAELIGKHVLPKVLTAEDAGPVTGNLIDQLRPLVFNALGAAAIRSADQRIPALVADRMAELMSDSQRRQPATEQS